MPCCFYILFSESRDRFYLGHTCDDLPQRIRKHNSNHKGFTGSGPDWELAYAEEFDNKEEAFARERQVKKWKSRKKIIQLIQNSG